MNAIDALKTSRESQKKQEKDFAMTAFALASALIQELRYKEAYPHLKDAIRLDSEKKNYKKTLDNFEAEFADIIDIF